MEPEQFARLQDAFLELRELQGDDRETRLMELCGSSELDEPQLRKLLEAHESPGHFLDSPLHSKLDLDRDSKANQAQETEDFQRPAAEGSLRQIGPYQILQQIGEGGHGVVYMAEQKLPIRRRVALKLIKPGMESKGILARFEAERQALAMMRHPSIANVLDAGTSETGRPYFVMELVHGTTIDAFCRKNQLSIVETLSLFQQVCNAVHHAHRKGIIHRDLKPGNILVTVDSGKPLAKVIDFGIAKAMHVSLTDRTMFTEYGQILGTLEYMSPEQATQSQDLPDVRSDVYSLGVVLYFLLTGTTPISRDDLLEKGIFELGSRIEKLRPPTPSLRFTERRESRDWRDFEENARRLWENWLRGDLDWITMKALSKDPARRYDSAQALADDLENFIHHRPVAARPPNRIYLLSKWVSRHRTTATLAATALLCALICFFTLGWAYLQSQQSLEDVSKAEAESRSNANALKESLIETEQEKNRADGNATRLAQMMERDLLENAWIQARDGDIDGAQQNLQLVPKNERGFLWDFIAERTFKKGVGSIREGSQSPIRQLAIHQPSGTMAIITTDSKLELWSLEDREQTLGFPLEPALYSCIAFNGEGNQLLIGAAGWISVVGLKDSAISSPVRHGRGGTRSLQWLPKDEGWLVTTGANYLIKYDQELSNKLSESQFQERIDTIGVAPDGRFAAVATLPGEVYLQSIQGGEETVRMLGPSELIQKFAWNDGGLTACDVAGNLWHVSSQQIESGIGSKQPLRFQLVTAYRSRNSARNRPAGSSNVRGVAIHDPESCFVANEVGEVLFLKQDSTPILIRKFSLAIKELVFLQQDRSLIVRHYNGRVNWIGKDEIKSSLGYAKFLEQMTDGVGLAKESASVTAYSDGALRKWEPETGMLLGEFESHDDGVLGIDIHEETQSLISYGTDWELKLHDLKSFQQGWAVETVPGVRVPCFSNDGERVAAAPIKDGANREREGTIGLYDAKSGKKVANLEGHKNWVIQLRFTKDGSRLVSLSADGTIRVWDVEQASQVTVIDVQKDPTITCFQLVKQPFESETSILCGHSDGTLSLRGLDDGALWRRVQLLPDSIGRIVVPEDSGIAFVSTDNRSLLTVVDLESLKVAAALEMGVGPILGIRQDNNSMCLQILGGLGAIAVLELPVDRRAEQE